MDRKSVKGERMVEPDQRRAQGKRRRGRYVLSIVACLAILVAVMYGGLMLYTAYQDRAREAVSENVSGLNLDEAGNLVDGNGNVIGVVSTSVVYSQEEVDAMLADAVVEAENQRMEELLTSIMDTLSNGGTVLEILRPLYPEYIVLYSGGKYRFIPINYDLEQSRLLTENLNILENGEIQYMLDGQVISHKGIDVSKFQEKIDWNLVAQDGVEFAFIRVGNRGFGSSGRLVEDERFDENIRAALAAGIKVGVYIYSQAITEEEAIEEANLVLKKIAPYNVECPVVFDVEKVVRDGGGRMNNLTPEERTNVARVFCQTIQDAGYKPMIYHNMEMGALMLDLTQLAEYDKWFAAYTDTLYYPYEYKVWQYSDTGRVQGIKGNVDLNICFAPLWE